MGLLDRVVSKELKKQIRKATDKIGDEVFGKNVIEPETDKSKNATTYEETNKTTQKVDFKEILATEFSNYEIKGNVAKSTFGAEGRDCEFGLFKDGKLQAVVIIVSERNEANRKQFKDARRTAENAGVGFANFYSFMPNERSYVVNRIKSFL